MARVAILGTGRVGRAIAEGLAKQHEVRFGSRNPKRAEVPAGTSAAAIPDAVRWAEVVLLAVPYPAVADTVKAAGPSAFRGKVLIDATNAIGSSGDLAVGHHTSGAEELAKMVPGSNVVKAFNTVFARTMSTGRVGGESLALFVAGDDAKAKEITMALGRGLGFDPVDAGPLRNARYLEPLAMQMMALAFGGKMGTEIGLKFVRSKP